MSFGVGTAAPDSLSLAAAFHQAPARFPELLRGRGALPAGIPVLLRLAGGASLDDEEFVGPPLMPIPELREAARFFIEQALLSRDADHYRVLGVSQDASLEEIKEHHRLLMRIFHPDRVESVDTVNKDAAARVNLAYNALRLPADRAAYDARLRQAPKATTVMPMGRAQPSYEAQPAPRKFALPPIVVRRLPQLVLGGVALVASLGVGVVYLTREPVGAIGAGEGRREQVSPPMHVAARDDMEPSLAAKSLDTSSPARPSIPTTLMSVAGPKLNEREPVPPASDHASRRMMIDAEPMSVKPPPPKGEMREIAPTEKQLRVVAQATQERLPERAAALQEEPGKASETRSTLDLQTTTDMHVAASAIPVRPTSSVAPQPPTIAPMPQPPLAARLAAQPTSLGSEAPQSPPPAASIPKHITQDDLANLVSQFSSVYSKGDIEAFLSLFSDDAHIEHGDKDRIRADYTDLFQSTSARQLYIWDMSWTHVGGGTYQGKGSYEAKVVRKGDSQARIYDGTIKLEVVQVNGVARVRAMFH